MNQTVLDLGGVLMNGNDVTLQAPTVTLSKNTVVYPSLTMADFRVIQMAVATLHTIICA